MAKYITSIRDLMIQAYNNSSDIKTKAKDGDPEACFQMGMIHLLGIKTPIDFQKASSFLENQSLADDPDACRLLGFIGECEGNYSVAFKNYAYAAGSNSKRPYLNKVFEERNNLQGFFKKLVLPTTVLNKEITSILNEYIKGGESKAEAGYKLVAICDDESIIIDDEQSASSVSFELPEVLEVIDLEGSSLLDVSQLPTPISEIMKNCDAAAAVCKKKWIEDVPKLISQIGKRLDEEEADRLNRQRDEEERALLEEQELRRNKIFRRYNIVFWVLSSPMVMAIVIGLFTNKDQGFLQNLFSAFIIFIVIIYLPYRIIKWIIKKLYKL